MAKLKNRTRAQRKAGPTTATTILSQDNRRLRREIVTLKNSLKEIQDELEKWRSKYHETDKRNGILNYQLTIAFIPELLKFLASAIGTGFAVGFYFAGYKKLAVGLLLLSSLIYIGITWLYRDKGDFQN